MSGRNESQKTLFLILSDSKALKQVGVIADLTTQDERFDVVKVTDVSQAAALLSVAEKAMIFFEANSRQSLVDTVTLLSAGARLQQKGLIKSLGFLTIPVPNPAPLETVLKQKGVTEILSERLAVKGLQYKLNRSFDLMLTAWKRATGKREGEATAYVDWTDALTTNSDFWILQKLSDVKLRRGMWMVHLVGPPPSCGKWEVDRNLRWSNLDAWVFKFSNHESDFMKTKGNWVFWGNRPTFSAQTSLWLLVSKRPKLALINPNGLALNRIKQDQGGILFAKNSPYSEEVLENIRRILVQEHRFRKEDRQGADLVLQTSKEEADYVPDFSISLDTRAGAPLGKVQIDDDDTPELYGEFDSEQSKALKGRRENEETGAGDDARFDQEQSLSLNPRESKHAEVDGDSDGLEDREEESGNYSSLGRKKKRHDPDSLDHEADQVDLSIDPRATQSRPKSSSEEEDTRAGLTSVRELLSRTRPDAQAGETPSRSKKQSITDEDTSKANGPEEDGAVTVRKSLSSGPVELQDRKESYDELFNELGFSVTVTPIHAPGVTNILPTEVKLLDLFEDLLSVEVPKLQLRKSQKVNIRFQVSNRTSPLDYTVSGAVTEIESVEDGYAVVGIALNSPDQKILEKFLEVFQTRQEQVSDFIASAKGR